MFSVATFVTKVGMNECLVVVAEGSLEFIGCFFLTEFLGVIKYLSEFTQ